MSTLLSTPQPLDEESVTGEVHLWYISLDQPVSRFQRLLSIEEGLRAEQYNHKDSRNHFIVRRGMLRLILGHYLSIEPSQLQFCYGINGKPALANTYSRKKVHFNLSHSKGHALYAFTLDHEIGVDIEHLREISDMELIAERFFTVRENAAFRTLPKDKKKEAFFNCWTRKEAFIKATGDGLSYPLNSFDVSLIPGDPTRLLSILEDENAASRWSIHTVEPEPGFTAAFVVDGQIGRVYYKQEELLSTLAQDYLITA